MADTQKETNPEKYPGFTGVGYPEVFTTIPPQPTEKKPGQLPPEKVKEYFEQVRVSFHGNKYAPHSKTSLRHTECQLSTTSCRGF